MMHRTEIAKHAEKGIEMSGWAPERIMEWVQGRRGLLVIAASSFILKLGIALSTQVINRDGTLYIMAAQEIASGHLKEAMAIYPMPAYSALIALVHCLIPDWITAARLISVVASTLLLLPVYSISEALFSRNVALWSCAALAVSPFPNSWAADVIKDPPFWLLFAYMVLIAMKGLKSSSTAHSVILLALAVIATLFRLEGLITIPLFFIFYSYTYVRKSDQREILSKSLITWGLACMLLVACLYVASGHAWSSVNRMDFIDLRIQSVLKLKIFDGYKAIDEQLRALQDRLPWPYYDANFAETARHYMALIYMIGLSEIILKLVFLPFVVALFLGIGARLTQNRSFILYVVVCYIIFCYFILVSSNFTTKRFIFPIVLFLYPWVGAGMARIADWIKGPMRPRASAWAFLAFFLVLPLFFCVKPLWRQDTTAKEAGKYLSKTHVLGDAIIMASDGRIPFYAGRGKNFVHLDRSDYPALERLATEKQVDLVAVRITDKGPIPQHGALRELARFKGHRGAVVIYCSTKFYEGHLAPQRPEDR